MGTNFYLSKKDSEKYVLPKLLNWLSEKANEVVTFEEDRQEKKYLSVLKWFDNLANTCNTVSYKVYKNELLTLLNGRNAEMKEVVEKALRSLENQHERSCQVDYVAFAENIASAIKENRKITRDDFVGISELILENIVFEDRDGAHIGKRSAAGDFCFNCNTTMCKGGKENVHYDGHDWHKVCPICGRKPEYTYSFSFQWSKDLWKEVFTEAKELDIYDEYDEHFTKEQFLNEELEKAKKACPENMWDYQLFYEDERRFS